MTHSKPSQREPSVLGGEELALLRLEPPSTDGFAFPAGSLGLGYLENIPNPAPYPAASTSWITPRNTSDTKPTLGASNSLDAGERRVVSNLLARSGHLRRGCFVPFPFPATTPGEKTAESAGVLSVQYTPFACPSRILGNGIDSRVLWKSQRANPHNRQPVEGNSLRQRPARSTRQAYSPRSTPPQRSAGSARVQTGCANQRPN